MERSTLIAVAAASTGIVAAAAIAGVAVVQTTATQSAPPPTVPLVAEPVIEPISAPQIEVPVVAPAPAASTQPLPTPEATAAQAAPSQESSPSAKARMVTETRARNLVLAQTPGEIVSIDEVKLQGRAGWAVRVARPDGSVVTGYVDAASGVIVQWTVNSPAATPSPSQAKRISADEARGLVMQQTSGAVLSVEQSSRQGRDAWAVRISRADGSIVTGYVDLASGVVFDWAVNQGPTNQAAANPAPADQAAPTPTNTSKYGDDDDHGDDHGHDHGKDDDDD